MGQNCLECSRKVSPLNLQNLQCNRCDRYFHPKCIRGCPPKCLKRISNFRYKVIRNKKWQCEPCVLSELPFYNISETQIKDLVKTETMRNDYSFPSCEQLNDLFGVDNNEENESNDLFDLPAVCNDTKYCYSSNLEELNFQDEIHDYNSFPIISVNIRSLVNRNNFTKFEGFLDTLSVKPLIIALNETWISDKSMGPHQSLPGYQFVHKSRKSSVGGGVAFYIEEKIHFNMIEELSIMKEKFFLIDFH